MYADHTRHRDGVGPMIERFTRALVAFGIVAVLGTGVLFATMLDGETSNGGRGKTYGARLSLGPGTARAYVTLDRGKPVEFGLALRETPRTESTAETGAATDRSSSRSTH